MNIKSVHWEPVELPDDQQWMELQANLKEHPAEWLIWEASPDPAIVAKLASIGINSAVFDPCANVPGRGDFITVMQSNIENLGRAYAP
jgi:zinc transport system substrate-binding protein